jgi:hypothetical protein
MIDKWVNNCEKNISKESNDVKTDIEKFQSLATPTTKKSEG